jgi:energy-coupling factor transporter ATP-binding protein EcfA2
MKPTMPGYAHFVWLFFMQPITLHERLKACGVDEPGISGWKWWRQRKALHENYRAYLLRLGGVLLLSVVAWSLLGATGDIFYLTFLLVVIAVGVAVGVAGGVAVGMAGGVVPILFQGMVSVPILTSGMVLWKKIGPTFNVPYDLSLLTVLIEVEYGVVLGVVAGVAVSVAKGVALGLAKGLALGLALGLVLGSVGSAVFGAAFNEVFGVAFIVAFTAAYLQPHLYLLEALMQFLLVLGNQKHPNRSLVFSPVLFDDSIYFPLPRLAAHIVAAASLDQALALRVIQAANHSPGTSSAASSALAQLITIELTTLLTAQDFDAINNLRGFWLPGSDTDNPLLIALSETARFMLAANSTDSPYIALQHLDEAQTRLQSLANQLLAKKKDPLARYLPPLITQWQHQLATSRQATQAKAANILPNPYAAGNPLSPEMRWGRDVFRGRETIINEIELLLADRDNSASIALIGPRRCGKSSLLKMLPVLLPDTLVVEFNLQGQPCDTPAAFYQALAQTAHEQALKQRRLRLPPLPADSTGTPIERLKQWFQQLEQFTAASRILICIDEFERIEILFPDQGRELQQFMGLLRATIQDCRRLRLLVAGTAPFDDLGRIWTDNFINLRELRVGYLAHPAVQGLLQAPIPTQQFNAIPLPVAEAIFQRTQGHPFLTQAFAYVLVNTLNRAKRKIAELDDLDGIEAQVLNDFKLYFSNAWDETPSDKQTILMALAQDNTPVSYDKATRRWLLRRLWIEENGQLRVPTFGRWLREWEDRD